MERIVDPKYFENSFQALIEIYNHFEAIQQIVCKEPPDYKSPAMNSVDWLRHNLIIVYLAEVYHFPEEYLDEYDELAWAIFDYFDEAIENKNFSLEALDKNITEALEEIVELEESNILNDNI